MPLVCISFEDNNQPITGTEPVIEMEIRNKLLLNKPSTGLEWHIEFILPLVCINFEGYNHKYKPYISNNTRIVIIKQVIVNPI